MYNKETRDGREDILYILYFLSQLLVLFSKDSIDRKRERERESVYERERGREGEAESVCV